ncbi:MAG TPA: radical SAM protein [Spirochaetota bacterium]|nr:radical SAM protein [Spirochaetota bacterium]HPH01701.1 radical SAM protein [Spirochaetota bacterium]
MHIFGPVPSRRLGRSLGIDCVPYKTCNLDCVYCECGATTDQTETRGDWFSEDEILDELRVWLDEHPAPDWITFAGSGEPCLFQGIGNLAKRIKEMTGTRLALITNGVLLKDEHVRKEARIFDLVLPSLDAATQDAFVRINRPLPGLDVRDIVEGLIRFREEFAGSIWLEVFIVPGVNDGADEIQALREAILKISPERIQLNSLDRPGTDDSVAVATLDCLKGIQRMIGLSNVEIISRSAIGSPGEIPPEPEAEKRIVMTLLRRPSTTGDLVSASGLPVSQVQLLLADMKRRGQIEKKIVHGDEFWVSATHGPA